MSRVERNAAMYEEDIKELAAADSSIISGSQPAAGIAGNQANNGQQAAVQPAITETADKKSIAKKPFFKKAKGTDSESHAGELTWQGKLMLNVGRAILALTLILCMFLMLPKFFGIKTYLVASGSMEPTIPVGSMIYSREVNPVNLKEGDIIVFLKQDEDNVPITHRVLNNDPDNKTLITKGDNNMNLDPMPILYNNVIGKVIWHTPVLGILSAPLTKPIGKLVMLLILLEGFLLSEVGSRQRKRKQATK